MPTDSERDTYEENLRYPDRLIGRQNVTISQAGIDVRERELRVTSISFSMNVDTKSSSRVMDSEGYEVRTEGYSAIDRLFEIKPNVLAYAFELAVKQCIEAANVARHCDRTREQLEEDIVNGGKHWDEERAMALAAKDNPILKKFGLDIPVEDLSEPGQRDVDGLAEKMGWGQPK